MEASLPRNINLSLVIAIPWKYPSFLIFKYILEKVCMQILVGNLSYLIS